jgi:hypothetical protein
LGYPLGYSRTGVYKLSRQLASARRARRSLILHNGLGLTRPHLRQDLGSPLPHPHRDLGSPLPHLRRDLGSPLPLERDYFRDPPPLGTCCCWDPSNASECFEYASAGPKTPACLPRDPCAMRSGYGFALAAPDLMPEGEAQPRRRCGSPYLLCASINRAKNESKSGVRESSYPHPPHPPHLSIDPSGHTPPRVDLVGGWVSGYLDREIRRVVRAGGRAPACVCICRTSLATPVTPHTWRATSS